MTFSIDHLVVCVASLEHNPYPLESVEGGRHMGHGTANRIVPLDDAYIELVSVIEPEEAHVSTFGRWISANMGSEGVDALCLRTDEIERLDPTYMSRVRPDGVTISWRLAGLNDALAQHQPFFIQWDDMDLHPARSHVNGGTRIDTVTFAGDRERLLAKTGEVDRVTYVDGPAQIDFTTVDS